MFPIALLAAVAFLFLRSGSERTPADSFSPGDFQLDGTRAKLTKSGLELLKKKLLPRNAKPLVQDTTLIGLDASLPPPAGATSPAYYSLQQALQSLPGSFAALAVVGRQGDESENLVIYFFRGGPQPEGLTYIGTFDELKASGFFA